MIEIKLINRVYLTLGFFGVILFLSGLSYASDAVAWRNGRNVDGMTVFGYTPLFYGLDYVTQAGRHVYGTHDWIAESALQLLYEKCAGNQQYGAFVQRLYGDLRYWYLLGSEIPDAIPNGWWSDGFPVGGYSVNIKTSCDNWVSNTVIGNVGHGVTFEALDPLQATQFHLQTGTNTASDLIYKGFRMKDCEWVAYYMGALAHFIGDGSYYPHTLHGWDGWEGRIRDGSYGSYVNHLTNTIYSNRVALDFFDINEARFHFDANDRISPAEAVYRVCVDVRYGNDQSLLDGWTNIDYLDAIELHDIFSADNSPWPEINEECELWTKGTRAFLEGQHLSWANYFSTIEHDLNTSIYYLASALNWLIYYYYTDCECTGEVAEDGVIKYIQKEQAEWIANDEGPWKREWLAKYDLSNMISMFGLVMALITVSVVKRLDILVYV